MIIDAKHRNWAIACGLLALLAIGLYALSAWQRWPVQPSGGSVAGLWLGVGGFLLLVFAGLLPLRKWYPLARLGSAQTWLRAHIWLSLLGSLLILLHSSFRWRGTLEQSLMLLLVLLVVSGIWGLIAQRVITRQLTQQLSWETFYENLPQECRMLQFEGDVLISRLCEAPLPFEADRAIATDERLKNRNVMGRDFKARLAKVYASVDKADAPPVEEPAPAAVVAPAPVIAADVVAAQPPAKGLSAAEKIALMRVTKSTVEVEPAPIATATAVAEAAPPATGAISTKDKLAMMRAGKKPASAPVATDAVPKTEPAIVIKPEARQIKAPPQPPPARKIEPAELAPFRQVLRTYFLDRVRPFLGWHSISREFATEGAAEISFARLRASLPGEFREEVAELEAIVARRRQLKAQARLYHWLHAWLVFVHIPAAIAMLVLAVAHIAGALYW